MEFNSEERVSVFIDGQNLHGTMDTLGWRVDYDKLREMFFDHARLVHLYYFTMLKDKGEDNVRKLTDYLEFAGYIVNTKSLKLHQDETGRESFHGSTAVDLAVTTMAAAQHIDHIVLITCNGDFAVLAQALQDMGKRVTVIAPLQGVSTALRRAADQFVDMAALRKMVEFIQKAP